MPWTRVAEDSWATRLGHPKDLGRLQTFQGTSGCLGRLQVSRGIGRATAPHVDGNGERRPNRRMAAQPELSDLPKTSPPRLRPRDTADRAVSSRKSNAASRTGPGSSRSDRRPRGHTSEQSRGRPTASRLWHPVTPREPARGGVIEVRGRRNWRVHAPTSPCRRRHASTSGSGSMSADLPMTSHFAMLSTLMNYTRSSPWAISSDESYLRASASSVSASSRST